MTNSPLASMATAGWTWLLVVVSLTRNSPGAPATCIAEVMLAPAGDDPKLTPTTLNSGSKALPCTPMNSITICVRLVACTWTVTGLPKASRKPASAAWMLTAVAAVLPL